MKFNYFFLLLISFVSFSLFSMDSDESSGIKVSDRKEKLKARSLPVTPFGTPPTSPYMFPKRQMQRKMSLFSLEDQLLNDQALLPKLIMCRLCTNSYPEELLNDHQIQCSKAIEEQSVREHAASLAAFEAVKPMLLQAEDITISKRKPRGLTKREEREKEQVPMDEN